MNAMGVMMRFRNPANNYIDERSTPWLWAALFGGFYFIAVGAVAALLIWVVLSIVLFAALGAAATPVILLMNVVYAVMAGDIVRGLYLRKGWVEVTDGEVGVEVPGMASGVRMQPESWRPSSATGEVVPVAFKGLRSCPFCAEEIKVEAVKCKHCGSTVEPVIVAPPSVPKSRNEIIEAFITEHGAARQGDGYLWQGQYFNTFDHLRGAIQGLAK